MAAAFGTKRQSCLSSRQSLPRKIAVVVASCQTLVGSPSLILLLIFYGNVALNTITCTGWWEQTGLGRQPMEGLRLRFDDGRILGAGVDVVGEFLVNGTVDGGSVLLRKQYVDAHQVDYVGSFDGEGTLQGVWSIFGVGGRWLIRVVGAQQSDEIVDLF